MEENLTRDIFVASFCVTTVRAVPVQKRLLEDSFRKIQFTRNQLVNNFTCVLRLPELFTNLM